MLQTCFAVPDARSGRIHATCRIVMHDPSPGWVGFPSERNFDFSALAPLRSRLVELEALALLPGASPARAFGELGERIARFLIAERLDFVFTTARVGIADGGHTAASMHEAAFARSAAPDDLRIAARMPLAVERLCTTLDAPPAPHLLGWLALGAWTCGEPAWNRDPHCAEIPLLLPLSRLRARTARRFLAQAA